MSERRTVKLTYFKSSGKYYSNGDYRTSVSKQLWEIWDDVETKLCEGKLPGLVDGAKEFYVLVDVPTHPHNHPHLVIPTEKL